MTDTGTLIIVAAIAAIPPTIAALGAIAIAWRNRQQTKGEIREVHYLVNSRMDDLLKMSKGFAKAEGKAEGKEEERDRVDDGMTRGENNLQK